MVTKAGLTKLAAAGVFMGAIACAPCAKEEAVATTKIPITTQSEDARLAYMQGRDLLEKLRAADAREYYAAAVNHDSRFALAHLGMANTATTATEFFDALERAVAVCEHASESEMHIIRAFQAAVNGDPETQKEHLDQLAAAFPEDERAQSLVGNFHFGRQEYPQAIERYRAATAVNPEFSPPYNQLGYALRLIEDFAGAEEAFTKYIGLIPDEPNPYDSYAELLMKVGRFSESIENYEKALDIDADFVASYVGIGNNLILMGRADDARATFERLGSIARNDGQRRQACTWAAVSYLHEGNHEAAVAEVRRRQAIAAETDDKVAVSADLNLTGNILLDAGRVEEAAQAFTDSVAAMDGSDATDEVKEATRRNHLFDAARLALARNDADAAAAITDQYRQLVGAHQVPFEIWRSHHLLGLVALARQAHDTAISELEQANRLDPRVLFARAMAHEGRGDADAARALYRRVADFNQLNVNLAYVRGHAMRRLGPGS